MNYVRLETRDGFNIRIAFEVLRRSKVIQSMCQHGAGDGSLQELVLPLHGVDHDVLLKILLWMEFHKDEEDPIWVHMKMEPDDIEHYIDDWDKEFLREKLSTVRALLKGADYLDIPWLVKLCTRKLRIRCSPEQYMHTINAIAPIE